MFQRAELEITLFDETDVIQTSDLGPDTGDGYVYGGNPSNSGGGSGTDD